MKLIFAGIDAEKRWFQERFGCQRGMPCPKYKEKGVPPIDPNYECRDCFARNGAKDNVTYVDVLPENAGAIDIAIWLKDYAKQFENCEGCAFLVNGKCFFDYHCPADLTGEVDTHNG